MQFVMIFIAPAVLAAACYMAMVCCLYISVDCRSSADEMADQGRIALHAAPTEFQTVKHLWIPPRYMSE